MRKQERLLTIWKRCATLHISRELQVKIYTNISFITYQMGKLKKSGKSTGETLWKLRLSDIDREKGKWYMRFEEGFDSNEQDNLCFYLWSSISMP